MGLTSITHLDVNAWEKRLPRTCLIEKEPMILDLCRHKAVLHLGAADSPFHTEAAASGRLLHQKLREVARVLVGIDIDRQAVDFLREHYAIEDIFCADALAAPDFPALRQRFDVVLCCDIIEHVDNPGALLDSCKGFMRLETLLVVTTINALAIKSGLRAFLNREAVHQHHVAYYSLATLCTLVRQHGLSPSGAGFFCYPTKSVFSKALFGMLAKYASGCADGLLITCKLRQGSES